MARPGGQFAELVSSLVRRGRLERG